MFDRCWRRTRIRLLRSRKDFVMMSPPVLIPITTAKTWCGVWLRFTSTTKQSVNLGLQSVENQVRNGSAYSSQNIKNKLLVKSRYYSPRDPIAVSPLFSLNVSFAAPTLEYKKKLKYEEETTIDRLKEILYLMNAYGFCFTLAVPMICISISSNATNPSIETHGRLP